MKHCKVKGEQIIILQMVQQLKTDMPTLRKLKEGDSLSAVSSGRPTIVGPNGQRKF